MEFNNNMAHMSLEEERIMGITGPLPVDAITLLGLNAVVTQGITDMRTYVTESARDGATPVERKNRLQELVVLQNQRYDIVSQYSNELLVQCFADSLERFNRAK